MAGLEQAAVKSVSTKDVDAAVPADSNSNRRKDTRLHPCFKQQPPQQPEEGTGLEQAGKYQVGLS